MAWSKAVILLQTQVLSFVQADHPSSACLPSPAHLVLETDLFFRLACTGRD
jgi:hypothetical protein